MALKIALATRIGLPAEYWSINYLIVDKFAKQAYIVVYGFLDKDMSARAKAGNANYLERKEYNVYPDLFDKYFSIKELKKSGNDQYKQAYKFVKDNVIDFKDAINIIE